MNNEQGDIGCRLFIANCSLFILLPQHCLRPCLDPCFAVGGNFGRI